MRHFIPFAMCLQPAKFVQSHLFSCAGAVSDVFELGTKAVLTCDKASSDKLVDCFSLAMVDLPLVMMNL